MNHQSSTISHSSNKTVSYSEYQKLTQEYTKLKQKHQKLKTEYSKLKELLDNYVLQIDEYTNNKLLIEKQCEICKQKILEHEQNFKSNCSRAFIKNNSVYSFYFSIIDNGEGEITYPELKEKYRISKDKMCSTSNSTNINIKNDTKFQHFKNTILDHYMNSINLPPHNNDIKESNSELYGELDKQDTYYEPVPSLIKFLKKY